MSTFGVGMSEIRSISNDVNQPMEDWAIYLQSDHSPRVDQNMQLNKVMKLYVSPCPNDTFMFDAMINNRIDTEGLCFDVEYFDIEELNRRAIAAESDFTR